MRRELTYWACQLVGWGGLGSLSILAALQVEGVSWRTVVVSFSVYGSGLVGTHLLRLVIRSGGWLDLPIRPLAPRILAGVFLVSGFLTVVYFSVGHAIDDPEMERIPLTAAPVFIVTWGVLVFVWVAIYFGVHYFEEREKAEAERWQLRAAVKEAELKALKSQLDPHFMFNCLNSIRALILEDPAGAQKMVTQLASLLRYSLQTRGDETVPLEREMASVRTYLELESIRLEERLAYRIDLGDGVGDLEVPPLVVQTLVENGIKHGVAPRPEGGRIEIRARRAGDVLHIRVQNTGELSAEGAPTTGVGLKNAMERIRLLYGDEGSLNVIGSADETVVADLEIPVAS